MEERTVMIYEQEIQDLIRHINNLEAENEFLKLQINALNKAFLQDKDCGCDKGEEGVRTCCGNE